VRAKLPRIHAVTDPSILDSPDFARRAAALTESGDVAVHVRSKTHGGRRLNEIAASLRDSYGAKENHVFINDRVDVALAMAAAGIHLPSAGLPTRIVRRLVGADVLIGRSTHSAAEALAAQEDGADYVFLGPIWPTPSHPGTPGIGVQAIAAARTVPVVAIGGVTSERVTAALDAGAYGVAAISALWRTPHPRAVVERMLLSFHS
jgi:thiamine-phosphate pyrophosphorylase